MNSLKGIPIVLILTCVIIGLCALSGFISGFVRKISGLVSFILACILVSIFLPTITSHYTDIHRHSESVRGDRKQYREECCGSVPWL